MRLNRQQNCWSLRCIWSIACRRCSSYIFILDTRHSQHLASLDWAETTGRRNENHLSFGIWCTLYYEFGDRSTLVQVQHWLASTCDQRVNKPLLVSMMTQFTIAYIYCIHRIKQKSAFFFTQIWWLRAKRSCYIFSNYVLVHPTWFKDPVLEMSSTANIASLGLNSLRPSDTYMRRWTGPSLVQIMACRLFGAKPLSEPILEYC